MINANHLKYPNFFKPETEMELNWNVWNWFFHYKVLHNPECEFIKGKMQYKTHSVEMFHPSANSSRASWARWLITWHWSGFLSSLAAARAHWVRRGSWFSSEKHLVCWNVPGKWKHKIWYQWNIFGINIQGGPHHIGSYIPLYENFRTCVEMFLESENIKSDINEIYLVLTYRVVHIAWDRT